MLNTVSNLNHSYHPFNKREAVTAKALLKTQRGKVFGLVILKSNSNVLVNPFKPSGPNAVHNQQ